MLLNTIVINQYCMKHTHNSKDRQKTEKLGNDYSFATFSTKTQLEEYGEPCRVVQLKSLASLVNQFNEGQPTNPLDLLELEHFSDCHFQINNVTVTLTCIAVNDDPVADCTALWWVDYLDLLRSTGAHDHGLGENPSHLGGLQVTQEHGTSVHHLVRE